MKIKFVRLLSHIRIKSVIIAVVIINLIILAGFNAACTATINSFKKIQTSDYSIFVPNSWVVEPYVIDASKDSPNIRITFGEKRIGGIEILSYNSSEPIEALLGNHVSRIIRLEKMEISKVSAMKVILERDWQTNNQRFVEYELHIYFMPGKSVTKYGDEIVYDLSLDSGEIDVQKNPMKKDLNEQEAIKKVFDVAGINEKQLNRIVKSFTLKGEE